MDICVRSAQQHQEKRPIGLVSGGGSAAFRALHDDLPFGRTNAPSPYAATLFQQGFKDRQDVVAFQSFNLLMVIGLQISLQVQTFKQNLGKTGDGGIDFPIPQSEPYEKQFEP